MEVFHRSKRRRTLRRWVAKRTFAITVIAIERLFINGTQKLWTKKLLTYLFCCLVTARDWLVPCLPHFFDLDLITRSRKLRIDSQTNLLRHQSSILGLLFLLFCFYHFFFTFPSLFYWLHNFTFVVLFSFDSGLRLSSCTKKYEIYKHNERLVHRQQTEKLLFWLFCLFSWFELNKRRKKMRLEMRYKWKQTFYTHYSGGLWMWWMHWCGNAIGESVSRYEMFSLFTHFSLNSSRRLKSVFCNFEDISACFHITLYCVHNYLLIGLLCSKMQCQSNDFHYIS